MKLALALTFIILLNIPFGYWRANVNKFTAQWFLSIHLPVPFVAAIRIFGEFGWGISTFAFLIPAFFWGNIWVSIIILFVNQITAYH